jgi:hypothetical protein
VAGAGALEVRLDRAVASRRHENDPRTPDVLLRAVPVRHDRFKIGAVPALELDIGSFMHSTDSHRRARSGISKKIEVSDFIH